MTEDPIAEDASPVGTLVEADLNAGAQAQLERIVEALLLASDQPLSVDQMQRLLGDELGIGRKEIREALERLDQRLTGGASELREVASGYRIQVRVEYAEWVARLWQEKPQRFSRALLETLALVCYRQPITRGEIEEIRGVSVSSNILRTLIERGWVREVGVKEVPGRPALFGTTPAFLDDFNLKSLNELPSLPEIKDLAQLDAALAQLTGELPVEVAGEEAEATSAAEAAAPAEAEASEAAAAEPEPSAEEEHPPHDPQAQGGDGPEPDAAADTQPHSDENR